MVRLFNIFSALLAFVICFFMQNNVCDEYYGILILPVIYLVLSFVLVEIINNKRKSVYRLTGIVLLGLQWIRCVLTPVLGVVSGYYNEIGAMVDSKDMYLSTAILLFETIIVFLFAILFIRYSGVEKEHVETIEINLSGDIRIYIIFVFFAFSLMLITGVVPFQFFALKTGTSVRQITSQDNSLILETIIMYGLTFLLIVIVAIVYKKYNISKKELFINIALIAVITRVALISSESRLALVYQIGAGLMLLIKLFPTRKKKIINVLLIAGFAVIGLLTIYKVFYAFLYSSYLEALMSNDSFGLKDIASQFDSYFYGVKTIGRNLSYANAVNDTSIKTWFLDFARNTFGIHYLFRNNSITTIEYYNMYIYSGQSRSGYLLSSVAYGYIYYGFVLAPLSTVFNFIIACFTEKITKHIKYIDIYYIMCIIYVRFAVSQFAFFSATWNYVSRTFLIGFVIIGLASLGRTKNHKKKI